MCLVSIGNGLNLYFTEDQNTILKQNQYHFHIVLSSKKTSLQTCKYDIVYCTKLCFICYILQSVPSCTLTNCYGEIKFRWSKKFCQRAMLFGNQSPKKALFELVVTTLNVFAGTRDQQNGINKLFSDNNLFTSFMD